MGFGGIWEGFWRGFGTALGELWTLLGHLKPIFWFQNRGILENNFVSPLLRLLESILGRFGSVWEGSGEDLGRFWEGFGEVLGFKKQAFWKIFLFFQNACFLGGGASIMIESFLI